MSEQVNVLKDHPSLNNEFFEKILQQKFDTDAIVLKEFTFDSAKDDGFGIQMARVKLNYSFSGNENMDIVSSTFMIKAFVIDTNVEDVLGQNNLLLKEAIFYLDILPDLYDIMDEKIVNTVFAPR